MKKLVAALIAVTLMAAPAAAQSKSALTGAELGAVLSAAGLQAEVTEDAQTRAPVAAAQAGAITFWVRALDCAGTPKACSTLMFFANFDLGREAAPADYQKVNAFNDRQVFGRAYLLPKRNEIGVDYVMELDGGVSADHISKNIARWTDVIDAFIGHFSSDEAGS
ncbi:MAG: YbjN domain-containing protein [Parvularculaceae bacterium]|nr:YbjN domain-containing protein [Parvularculaceae bacterium]